MRHLANLARGAHITPVLPLDSSVLLMGALSNYGHDKVSLRTIGPVFQATVITPLSDEG